ncbi:MAG: hypothetical protein Q8P73_01460 [bacterium]|nr:hypothetical protein [bacterium]MDZ4344441.1 hypothetical protein [Candidatus Binatia bacterium]
MDFTYLISALWPIYFFISPGIIIWHIYHRDLIIIKTAYVLLWSLVAGVLGTLGAVAAGLDPIWYFILSFLILLYVVFRHSSRIWRRTGHWPTQKKYLQIFLITAILALYFSYGLFFIYRYAGLPTGDSQKAIYWGQQILINHHLPDYSSSIKQLHRDPIDFYTPGLHAFTALIIRVAPQPLAAVGFTSIAVALAIALLASACAITVFPRPPAIFVSTATVFLLLTNFRFLRYIATPGYHFQNVFGEVFIFGLLFVGLRLLRCWRWSDIILALLLIAALAVSHQFSLFLGAFILLPTALLLLINLVIKHRVGRLFWTIISTVIATVLLVGWRLGLLSKIPHLFSSSPHLANLLPAITDYPDIMGAVWLGAGLAGLVVMLSLIRHPKQQLSIIAFAAGTIILLFLSQAPRFFIDIPPVRTLFYAAFFFSITGAFFLYCLWSNFSRRDWPRSITALVATVIIIGASVWQTTLAFTPSLSVRTNSTLTPAISSLIDYLHRQTTPGAILPDDYNRRTASWLLLAGHPTYSRVAADLQRQMQEAGQSSLRYQLYLNQLDMEKIFSLGSSPVIQSLLAKQNINWLTGITGTSDSAFAANPILTPVMAAHDTVLYSVIPNLPPVTSNLKPDDITWLLRSNTIANDIGDDEDTYEHLPASLRATRLSAPQKSNGLTFRSTKAPVIPLRFNIGDYVQALWDKENTGYSDTNLELMVELQSASSHLSIDTPTGRSLTLPTDSTTILINSIDAPIDNQGFITFNIINSDQAAIAIDLIALGQARTP